jgi:hypothetical protein
LNFDRFLIPLDKTSTMAMELESNVKSRVSDLFDEPVDRLLLPIQGYENEPLLTLNETIKPIANKIQLMN